MKKITIFILVSLIILGVVCVSGCTGESALGPSDAGRSGHAGLGHDENQLIIPILIQDPGILDSESS